MIVPNGYDCEECEHWDPVNGCWRNEPSLAGCSIWWSEYSGERL